MKILSIVGARPQFVKAAVLTHALNEYQTEHKLPLEHRLLHTGQHYDSQLSDVFFRELDLPQPDEMLGIGSGSHGMQTAAMLASIEASLTRWCPDIVIVYGDTNSTAAGALAAVKMHIPVLHLEAGLRSFDRRMPEEINRIVTDHISEKLLAPTHTAMKNLEHEGLADRSVLVGDVMLDAAMLYGKRAHSEHLGALGLACKSFALATLHRAGNTDHPGRLSKFLDVMERCPIEVVLPVHPRLRDRLGAQGCERLRRHHHIHLLPPVGYLEMLALEHSAKVVMTDSGGVQKEAYFLGTPCLTLRDETEWQETLDGGWNRVVGLRVTEILDCVNSLVKNNGAVPTGERNLREFGSGRAGLASVEAMMQIGSLR
jgi:UDP-N-acetylglucosamine 2-epimerase